MNPLNISGETWEESPREATLADLGEARVLHLMMPLLEEHRRVTEARMRQQGYNPALELGPGDDCAVLKPDKRRTVVSTDTLIGGQDFLDPWPAGISSGGYDVGWKAATQNLADVAAMGAEPVSLFISLSLPSETCYGWVEDFAHGVLDSIAACGAASCVIGGGDLGTARDATVTVTALGRCETPVLRSGAHPGDTVALAGSTGWADAGLRLLLTAGSLDQLQKLDPKTRSHVECAVEHQLRPVSPIAAGQRAADAGATAMLDLSDGIAKDAGRIAEASGVDLVLDPHAITELARDLLPVAGLILQAQGRQTHQNAALDLARECLVGGGEDHGLLACFKAGTPLPKGFQVLGYCTVQERQTPRILLEGQELRGIGWEHYRQ